MFMLFFSSSIAQVNIFKADNSKIIYSGRVDKSVAGEATLIGSASTVSFRFAGDSCTVYLRNDTWDGLQNYVVFELDGEYLGRQRIDSVGILPYPLKVKNNNSIHTVKVIKATEAQNGYLTFAGITCRELLDAPPAREKAIEFIGNSITCGQGIESETIPCNSDQWYDQHNAYLAYGPIVARKLGVDYMLSSVSGIGIYRTWNDTGSSMPMVYENLFLNTDSSRKWDFKQFKPDIVSICLGTNDLSDGDGKKERLPFDKELFASKYIRFVQTVFNHYPDAKIVLLNSPMISGDKNKALIQSLKSVIHHFSKTRYKPVELFEFVRMEPQGCDYHPGKTDHQKMANQLYPFYKKILNNIIR